MWALLTVTLLVAAVTGRDADYSPIVATREGLVQGVLARSAGGDLFYSFKGIPYAQPPLGQLRFRPPQRHTSWMGVVDASEHGSQCAQFDFSNNATRVGSEDCLFANVYSRQLPQSAEAVGGLPVMVYVHGGGFFFGDGNSDFLGPRYFMDEGVVLVTFNYRLGVFGFFTTHDGNAPGNYGLLDQVLLLQWVQDNIAAFGGDPEQVTIFGESAGGSSVSLLVLSPLTKGLFHHAISQSGASISSFAANGRRKGLAARLAKQLNCDSDDVALIVDCMRGAPENALLDVTEELEVHFKNAFTPRVDREAAYPFLPEDPRILLETGRFNLVPWMSGMTEEEGAAFLPRLLQNRPLVDRLLAGDMALWSLLVDLTTPSESNILDCGAKPAEEIAKVFNFYTTNGTISLLTIARVFTDRVFVSSISEEIRLAAAHAPVYKYVLDHKGPGRQRLADLVKSPLPDFGVTHVDDLLYLFSSESRPLARPGSPAHTMIRFMVSLWTSFARTGRPSSDVLSMPDWPIFTEQSQRHMRLNSEPSLGERLFEERVNFWQTVGINEPWRHAVQTNCEETKAAKTEGEPPTEEVAAVQYHSAAGLAHPGCAEAGTKPCLVMDLLV